jgi:fatty acid desaturase
VKAKLFAHSRLDGLLVLVALAQLGLLLLGIVTFGAIDWYASLAIGLVAAFLICTNFQCVAHNFIHNPFFRGPRLNRAFAVFNSLLIGTSQSIYRVHHLHHHRYNNDRRDPVTGTTKDFTSTWRHSSSLEREENVLRYSLFGYFRSDLRLLFSQAGRRALLGDVLVEFLAVAGMVLAFGVANPLGLVCFYLPVWLLGNVLAQAENYLEHYGAFPGNRKTDSVSCYGKLYNLVWFNNGYHQEHHYRPQVHWSTIAAVRPLLPPETERRVVRGAHWFNLRSRDEQAGEPVQTNPGREVA